MSVYKKGNSYYFKFIQDGRQHCRSCGQCTEEQAEKLEAKYRSELIDQKITGYESGHTIHEAVMKWLKEYTSTLKLPEKYYDHAKALEPYMKQRPIEDIFLVAHEVTLAMQKHGNKNTTINRRLSVLRRVANLAHAQWKWLGESPYRKFKMLSEKGSKRTTALTFEDVDKLAGCAPSEFTRDAILFAAYTGLRGAEIYRIGNGKSFLKDDMLTVDGKNGIRQIPINQASINFVERWTPCIKSINVLKDEFRMARFKAGMVEVKFHDLRHTYGTWLADQGRENYVIMRMMGHETSEMAKRYINQSMPALRKVVFERPVKARKHSLHKVA